PLDFETSDHGEYVRTSYRYRANATPTARVLAMKSIQVTVQRTTRFDPLRLTDDISWIDDQTGEHGSLEMTITSFFVPESATTSHVYWFAAMKNPRPWVRPFLPFLRLGYRSLLRLTTVQDESFLRACAEIPFEMKGMRLGRLDRPVAMNLNALRRTPYQ